MPVSYARLARSQLTVAEVDELRGVDALAADLSRHLEERASDIDQVHVHGAPSAAVQRIVSELLKGANWSESGEAREKQFIRVERRIGAFFGDPRREVDVVSAHLFGYGRSL